MPTPDALIALTTPAVRDATRAYLTSRNAAAYEKAMQQALAKGHTAAAIRGIADRTGIMPEGLSRAERDDIKAKLKSEFDFLKSFIAAAPDLSDAEIATRAALYPGATRAMYYQAFTNNALPLYPGSCPQCYGRCRCSVDQRDGDWYWNAANDKATCDGCRQRGADWQPYVARSLHALVAPDVRDLDRRATIAPVRTPSGRLVGMLDPQTLILEVKRGGRPSEHIDLKALLA
jgi:hypothetical protein